MGLYCFSGLSNTTHIQEDIIALELGFFYVSHIIILQVSFFTFKLHSNSLTIVLMFTGTGCEGVFQFVRYHLCLT